MDKLATEYGSGGNVSDPIPEVLCPQCGKSLMGMYWFCTFCGWRRK